MAGRTFTEQWLKSIATPAVGQRDYWEAKSGLGIRVSYGGKRSWMFRYRLASGQRRRYKLGDFPATTLKDARIAATDIRSKVNHGADPAADRKGERAAEDTFKALAADYMENYAIGPGGEAAPRKKSWREDRRLINRELGALMPRKVKDIKRRDVHALVQAVANAPRRAPVQALAILGLLSKMFNYAMGTDKYGIDFNPADRRVPRPGKRGQRTRVLNDAEIRELWQALMESPAEAPILANGQRATRLQPDLADGMRLRLLTAQRGAEVFSMTWLDVDLQRALWTVPASISKNKIEHLVPLCDGALAILKARRLADPQGNGLVFGRVGKDGRQIDMVQLARKAANYLVKGRSPRKIIKRRKLTGPGVGINHFTGHDLRRTAASGMAAAGISHEHIARVLNHKPVGPVATSVYNRYSYINEKRRALETWERKLAQIIADTDKTNVVPFVATATA